MRVAILMLALSAAPDFSGRAVERRVEKRLQGGDTQSLAAEAFDAMFIEAAFQLEKRGYSDRASLLTAEWKQEFRRHLFKEDMGDHAALSEWVAKWYAELELLLGVEVMELTHLRDIWVLNYSLPVVFAPKSDTPWCKEQLAAFPLDTCKDEYKRHFAGTKYAPHDEYATAYIHYGFGGVVAYWAVWGTCTAATSGIGSFLICSPAAWGAKAAITKWVAPKASDAIWSRSNR